MAERPAHTQPETVAQSLLIDGMPPCAIVDANGTYFITARLTLNEAAALAAASPSHDELCQHAQHALGLSASARASSVSATPSVSMPRR